MHTININVAQGHSYENFEHENLSQHESFQIYSTQLGVLTPYDAT